MYHACHAADSDEVQHSRGMERAEGRERTGGINARWPLFSPGVGRELAMALRADLTADGWGVCG